MREEEERDEAPAQNSTAPDAEEEEEEEEPTNARDDESEKYVCNFECIYRTRDDELDARAAAAARVDQ